MDYKKILDEMMVALKDWQEENVSEEVKLKISEIRRIYFNRGYEQMMN